ncbi:MAG: hypothetical protein R3F39_13755 [Myxococcota bacterium]
MADRTSEAVRVCVRCGREGGLRDVRCAECGFDLTSDLQRDYDRYRSTTSGRGQAASDSLDAAQQRKKTAPNAHGALGRFTPAPGGKVLDDALDSSRRDRAGRSSPVGSSSDVAARTRGGGQRTLGSTSMRPPAPPPPPSRLTGTHAPSVRRAAESESKEPTESVADLLARHSEPGPAADEAGPRTSAWHPGSQSDEGGGDPALTPVGEGGPGDAPVTRAWGEIDEAREREALAAAAAALEPALSDPLAPTVATGEEKDPVAAALAEAAAEALAAAVAPAGRGAANEGAPQSEAGGLASLAAEGHEVAAPPIDEATAMLRVEDFTAALASFGMSDDDDEDGVGDFDSDDSDEPEDRAVAASQPANAAPAAASDDATVMIQAAVDAVDEPTVAIAAMGADDEVDNDAPTVMAARPTVAAELAGAEAEAAVDDAKTVIEARSAAAEAAEDLDDDDHGDDDTGGGEPDTEESEAVEAAADSRKDQKKPGSRRKRRKRAAAAKAEAEAASQPASAPAAAEDPEATRVVAAVEPETVTATAAPVQAQRAPAEKPQAAASPPPHAPTRPGERSATRPPPSQAAMRAEALAPSRAFGGGPKSGPISQNLRPGTTTYVDATRKGFRRAQGRERDQSGVYVGVGVVLGLVVLAALLYFSR